MRIVKIVAIILVLFVLFAALYVGGSILYATFTDYQPPIIEDLDVYGQAHGTADDSTYTFLIWNIGYGGLGAEVDFFYDGGETVTPPGEYVRQYLDGISKVLNSADTIDFVLLQEVDTLSKRSHKINEMRMMAEALDNHAYSFATNYLVDYIPIPFTNPMGKVTAGLASYTQYSPIETKRYSFPGNFEWPKRVFFLDRCFLFQRIALSSGKDLVVINTHNSAYDDGNLKQQQMAYLKDILLREYENGNYVVVGGDWNQSPPLVDPYQFGKPDYVSIREDFLPSDWLWVYDVNTPTNRSLKYPYKEGETFTGLIDFYLISPNLRMVEVKTFDLNFQYSDHQPVFMKVKLAYK